MIPPPNVWGVLGNATPVYEDLHHAWMHAGPDEPTEDADGYVFWNGKSPNAMDSSQEEA